MLKSEMIMLLCLHYCGFTVQMRPLFTKASFSCFRQVKEQKWVWLVLVWRMTSNKGLDSKMVWMSVTSRGKYLWPPGTEKKTGSPEEPLQAIPSSSSMPFGLCLYLASVCVCLCVYTPLTEFASASCPCCLSLAALLEAADAISWQYCGSPCYE